MNGNAAGVAIYNSPVRFIVAASGGCVKKKLCDGDNNNKAVDAENPNQSLIHCYRHRNLDADDADFFRVRYISW